jgi:hypothetical protein
MECGVLRQFGIAPAWRVGDLKKMLGSGFEMIRISQCASPRVFRSGMSKTKLAAEVGTTVDAI